MVYQRARALQTLAPASQHHSVATSTVLHLLPGVVMLAGVWLIAPLVARQGYPLEFAGALMVLLLLAPLELGVLLWEGRRATGRWSLAGVVRYRQPVPRWQYVVLVPLLVFWFFQSGSLWRAVEPALAAALAGLPGWLLDPLPGQPATSYASSALRTTALLGVLASGIVAPVVEELYFRGYLLPRIEHLGWRAVLLNTVLFALQHLWTPLATPGRILAWLPIVYVAYRQKNLYISLAVHLITNLFGTVLFLAAALGA